MLVIDFINKLLLLGRQWTTPASAIDLFFTFPGKTNQKFNFKSDTIVFRICIVNTFFVFMCRQWNKDEILFRWIRTAWVTRTLSLSLCQTRITSRRKPKPSRHHWIQFGMRRLHCKLTLSLNPKCNRFDTKIAPKNTVIWKRRIVTVEFWSKYGIGIVHPETISWAHYHSAYRRS